MKIDAENLLSTILSSGVKGKKRKKKHKRKKSDDMVSSLLGNLTSGKNLITAIGLGVGAYEIFRQQSTQTGSTPPPPPSSPPSGSPATPPPLPGKAPAPPVPPPGPVEASGQELALKLIQTMIGAAHADGNLDEAEEKRILEQLQEQGLSPEEKQFLLLQLHHPKPIAELSADVTDQRVAQTMYSLAVSTIEIDTVQERQWLDTLAAALGISPALQKFIEQEL